MASALTTVDNPYDPFKDFDKWFLFDIVTYRRDYIKE